jgi:hypothetical protein
MKKLLLLCTLCLAFGLGSNVAYSSETSTCLSPDAPRSQTSLQADGQVAQNVLCCCRTYQGQCCNYVSFCSGFIPGCVCSGHKPEISEDPDTVKNGEVKRSS